MPQTLDELTSRFSLPELTFKAGRGGLLCAAIDGEHSTGELYLQGAHVTQFMPRGQSPLLWMSQASQFESGQPIRGGVPICFPWFGPHPQDAASAPAHGTARIVTWHVVRAECNTNGQVQLALQTHIAPFELLYEVTFARELSLSLTVRLPDEETQSASFEEALHTYLHVGDIRECAITGLEEASYNDKVLGASMMPATGEAIHVDGECDRVYLETITRCELHDRKLDRGIFVEKKNSFNTVVWNPWIAKSERMPDFGNDEWSGMVCIESANVGDRRVTLLPGKSHCLVATLGIII